MVEATKTLKMGEGNEPDVFLGPIQNSMQYEKVKGFFEDVKKEKYDIAVGGENPQGEGYFITPTIVDRPAENSKLVVEEPFGMIPSLSFLLSSVPMFRNLSVNRSSACTNNSPFPGPIVPLLSFKTDEEAIQKANNTMYGLGASVWSGDMERANKLAQRIEAGNVWVNNHFHLDPRVPFGGHKESGIGTEWGVAGLISYCNSQSLYLQRAV